MIYFDNSATTKINEDVLTTYLKVTEAFFGNPSSLHGLGVKATALMAQARKQIAENLCVSVDEIFFTSGGTEGDNWAIKGTAIEKKDFGRHLITSSIEHPAVTESMKQLEFLGFEVTYLPVSEKGYVSVSDVEKAIRPDTIMVSIMAINNEVGTIQPIEEIGHLLGKYPKIHFHVDAVQAVGKMALHLGENSRVDIATFSAHKFHGMRGTGFIYLKKGRKLAPLLSGGGQEDKLRSGTENVAGIAGMAKALRLALANVEQTKQQLQSIQHYLHESLAQIPQIVLFSGMDDTKNAPHILCFALKGVKGEVLVHALEAEDIFVSTTSACSSKSKAEASTLAAMNVPSFLSECAIRLSLSGDNTMAEAEQFLIVMTKLKKQFAKVSEKRSESVDKVR